MEVPYYEAVFRYEERGERLAEWEVVEWNYVNRVTGAKCGRRVKRFSGTELGGLDAMTMADELNRMKESENA